MAPDPSPNPSRAGTRVKALFTIACVARYAFGMVIFAAAMLAATLVPQAVAPVSPERQARATVTILTSSTLRFAEIERTQPKSLRESRVRGADGTVEKIKLVEFQ